MLLRKVNLNLLVVLRELLKRRSISAVASELGRTASAISQSLAQLRRVLDDPLLVRVGSDMALTPRAIDLIGPVEDAYSRMELVLTATRFDPATTSRRFVIAATDYDAFAEGPAIVSALRRHAPDISVRIVDIARDLGEQMNARTIDLALMPDFLMADVAPHPTRTRKIASVKTAVLMRAGHALAGRSSIDRSALLSVGHVAFSPSWGTIVGRSVPHPQRWSLTANVHLPHVMLVPAFLANTDDIALVPLRVAERVGATFGLTWRPTTENLSSITSVLAWSVIQDADPGHRWLRETVIKALRGA